RLSLNSAVIRVRDLAVMQTFCSEVLGLPLLLSATSAATFELGSDARGHSQVLMLIAGDGVDAPNRLTLEISDDDFPAICRQLRRHGATLYESENSSARGCAWRVLSCQAPEGHHLQVVSIDPRRCAPTLGLARSH
ncbi:MAG TPA: VOC family protein, partial [Modicisalibacter sp.]|nr:VOC family protein [Modicisalibacter sp.]